MRYLTVLAKPNEDGAFHPLGEKLTNEPSIRRRAIHHIELLDDDTVLLFAEASGDKQRYEEIMEDSEYVISYLTAGESRWALELQRESLLVVDTPIRFTSEDNLKITYLGTEEIFKKLYDYAEEADHMSFDILATGEHETDGKAFSSMITSRQEEVLEAAVELGYYNEPRRASLEDISEAVGVTPGTVGEHLRKVEQRVFSEIIR
jgi:predicted DNA binding protein